MRKRWSEEEERGFTRPLRRAPRPVRKVSAPQGGSSRLQSAGRPAACPAETEATEGRRGGGARESAARGSSPPQGFQSWYPKAAALAKTPLVSSPLGGEGTRLPAQVLLGRLQPSP